MTPEQIEQEREAWREELKKIPPDNYCGEKTENKTVFKDWTYPESKYELDEILVADYWLSRMQAREKEVREEIVKAIENKKMNEYGAESGTHLEYEEGFNAGLKVAATIARQSHDNKQKNRYIPTAKL